MKRLLLMFVLLVGLLNLPAAAWGQQIERNGSTTIINTGSTGAAQNTFLVSGGEISWNSDYEFTVSAATYYIDGTLYTSAQTDVTLSAADATNDRIDVIAVNSSGAVVVIAGTAAAQPSEPNYEPGSQLKLGVILVEASTTAPATSSTTLLYAENVGSGSGEWDWTTSGSGFNVNSTSNPRAGTKVIEGTSVSNGAYAQGQIGSGTLNASDIDLIVFHIRSKASWSRSRVLQVQILSSGVLKGQSVTVQDGAFGFSSSNTSAYQQIAIPISQFAIVAGTTFNQVRFRDSGGAIGFYIDDVSFKLTGVTQVPSGLGVTEADARYYKQTDNPLVLKAQFGCTPVDDGNSGAADTINWDGGCNMHKSTLTGNVTYTFTNPMDGGRYVLYLFQDGTGSRTVTWPAEVLWSGGTPPTLTTTASKLDVCTFVYLSSTAKYYGACNLNY
jgi:hypothetical protein